MEETSRFTKLTSIKSLANAKTMINTQVSIYIDYCKYGVLVFGDDGTGPADESKRTKRVQGWSRSIMGGWLFIICNTISL